jgi:hypothetical protein
MSDGSRIDRATCAIRRREPVSHARRHVVNIQMAVAA